MNTQQVAQQEMKWARGHQMTVRDWLSVCQYSRDVRFQNLYHALVYGLETGRLPNWQQSGYNRYFTRNSQQMSNVQTRNLLARAADNQEELTTGAALKALQAEFGLVVR